MFKVGDKVKYVKIDPRHYDHANRLRIGTVCTITSIYFDGNLEIRECKQFNYQPYCFKLFNPRKLKIKLP